jgi:hypothetical protein
VPPPDPQDRITLQAQALLDESVDILNTTPTQAPPSQFLCTARPPIDCEFVAVQMARIAEDNTSPLAVLSTKKRKEFGNIILLTYVIWVIRCAPEPTRKGAPTDAEKTRISGIVMKDGWVLWNGIRIAQNEIFDGCEGIYFDGGTPVAESGGFQGWTFQIRASLPGYDAE